ncbi:geranylgeranyl transferase type-2 subunit alpha [Coccinella septempunctata]|uniref:geranylgeranyl transferase type-2 subunit alpha n=1 Tax=Coccinella septempunctata TaxID=41139 RepID=UPI001D062949|nr:geranylgeranyl transferase type-2 subunit alpha [Coccinella septempunctata]
MHGRLKVRTTEEQKLLKEKENQKKLAAYKKGMAFVLATRKKDSFNEEAFSVSSQILLANSHIYTLWNYRKEVILMEIKRCKEGSNKEIVEFLEKELDFTEQCILSSPKCYSSWHHRYWVLENHPEPNWEKEFQLCSKYLIVDDRNFHCWDYRRLILNKTGLNLEKELEFSTERLNANFSNYSSWHYRSTLRILDVNSLDEELNLVQNAVFTDPYDSSAWFYFRWILNHREILKEKREQVLRSLKELEELEPGCKWVLMAKFWVNETLSGMKKEKRDDPECMIHKLIELDPLRKKRYFDSLGQIDKLHAMALESTLISISYLFLPYG